MATGKDRDPYAWQFSAEGGRVRVQLYMCGLGERPLRYASVLMSAVAARTMLFELERVLGRLCRRLSASSASSGSGRSSLSRSPACSPAVRRRKP